MLQVYPYYYIHAKTSSRLIPFDKESVVGHRCLGGHLTFQNTAFVGATTPGNR